MKPTKVTFKNASGQELIGRLDLPLNTKPKQFAIFVHCFTCHKNLNAVKHISRALAQNGFGVLRFDFTGLGESEGDFSESNFSGNISDLLAASQFLETHYKAPSLMVGHSLGGTAGLFAGFQLDSIKAIVTIGSPSSPGHVQHLFQHNLEEIKAYGQAEVNIGGRPFSIKKQFIDDLESKSIKPVIRSANKALLILHSPSDLIVELKNAEELYKYAQHPKSFVTLVGADHLLTKKEDSIYVGEVISSWAKRYVSIQEDDVVKSNHQVAASLDGEDGFTTLLKSGSHQLLADEPTKVGGLNLGPAPYELVSSGLAACTVMTLQMYAKRKKWPLENVEVHINHSKQEVDGETKDVFEKNIKFKGNLDEKQTLRLKEIANRCPVHKTLNQSSIIRTI